MPVKTQDIIKQLTSDTKIKIACHIISRPQGINVSEIVGSTNCKRTNISKQINEMYNAGFLSRRDEGRKKMYFLNPDLHSEQVKFVKSIIKSFHMIDEGKDFN